MVEPRHHLNSVLTFFSIMTLHIQFSDILYHWIKPYSRIVYKNTVYPKKYAHGFCFAVLCCGYTLTDFPISIRLTSLALWQSNDCPSASKATLMNMDKYFMWIHYERLHNHNKAKHNKTVCIFLGIYCILSTSCSHSPALKFHSLLRFTLKEHRKIVISYILYIMVVDLLEI